MTSKLQGKDAPQVGMSNVEKLKQKLKLKMSDTNAKPSLPPPRRQPAAHAVNRTTLEDNFATKKTKEVKFEFENIIDKNEDEVLCEFANKLPVNFRTKKTLQSDENGRQPAVQEIKEDILTPPSAVQYLNLKSSKLNPQNFQIKEAPLVWPHPELTEQ